MQVVDAVNWWVKSSLVSALWLDFLTRQSMLSNASYLVDDMIAFWDILDGNKCPSKSVQDEGIEAC